MVSRDRLVVIPNGVDTGCWKPLEQQAAGKDKRFKESFVWLAAGRLEPVKNYPALLDAFAQLPPTALLVIAGTGPLEVELRRQCAHLSVESRVDFLGHEPNLLGWMQKADAVVLASLWEGLPTVLLEAGACGLAAVATDVAGSRDVLVDGETGLLARSGSVNDLAEAMMTLMRMAPVEREALVQRARERVLARFSLEAVLDRWDAFYCDLLNERPSPSRWGHASNRPA
jgi:glycosyltransferase involved in cell wall biosynthesis